MPGETRSPRSAWSIPRAPEEPHPAGLQVLRVLDDAALRAGHHLRGRAQRLGQVQRRRRHRLGDGRAGRQEPARRQDGGRHLRRHVRPPAARPRRGAPHDRQHRRRPADRLRRGHHLADDVPQRRLGVRHQRHPVPPARRAGAAERTPASAARCTSSSGRASSTPSCRPRPEDRRGFIEEAAGVLKHRKRKEKALRKLDAMQANLTRLQDLTTELRRQLKPLGKQAEVARRAAVIQADLRDARLRLIADDLISLRDAVQQEVADETALRERRGEVESELAGAQAREAVLEAEMAGEAPALARAQETWFRPVGPARARLAAPPPSRPSGCACSPPSPRRSGPAAIPRSSTPTPAPRARRRRARPPSRRGPRGARRRRSPRAQPPRRPHAAEERRLAALQRAAADRREGLARLTGQVNAATSRLEARAAELERLAAQAADARARADKANADFHALETQVAGTRRGRGRARRGARARRGRARRRRRARPESLRMPEQEAERERARPDRPRRGPRARAWPARTAAPRCSPPATGSPACSARSPRCCTWSPATRPPSPPRSAPPPTPSRSARCRAADALDAAQGPTTPAAPRSCSSAAAAPDRSSWPACPPGAVWAARRRRGARRPCAARSVWLLARVALVDDLADARAWSSAAPRPRRGHPRRRRGRGRRGARRVGVRAVSLLEVQAAVDEARAKLDADATHRYERRRFELGRRAPSGAGRAAPRRGRAGRLHESDARMAAVAEQLGQLG